MKTIGLIGGMSWESSAQYYALINRGVRDRCSPLTSARLVMVSLDFAEIAAHQAAGEWGALGERMAQSARSLARAGADCVVLCTNTMHLLTAEIEAAVDIPFLHIADAAGVAIETAGIGRVGLLGTRFTMEQPFYRDRLAERHGLEVLVPEEPDRATVHRVIYDELVSGIVSASSRAAYRDVIARLIARGAQGIVLGCTEIMLLLDRSDSAVPLFDTTALHAAAAVDFALP